MKKDFEIKELTENNYRLKYQLDELNSKVINFQNQDHIISDAQNRIIQLQVILCLYVYEIILTYLNLY